ncbi:DNA-binding transcriptional response regulator, NtrC family, contains REC, AAA-type ATPase, and a Fis-type DNA-binding domains [Tindallia magadiensis]|uniref:Stage 0 sporulation protein A homolog n=1 Tax=Tindallia magadiensis TaxID=69895 RepID=A0A1I3GS62_9FIRM|nr:sigma-54 dependent transcriptional regulator [Tindallia magadiensis]SFI26277.1 DNA-binding transcriptional response regulator, NtrC family, contains REC, AAA-type ATPase, and a Fis-type DNA-binding domains [Tindallia magadiensis]
MEMNQRKMLKVLIVDDEEAYREVLQTILEKKGYETDTAANGKEALEKLKRKNYHLVLTDLMMDEVNGMELLEQIKANYRDTEVIMVTGYGTIQNAVEAMKKGAFTYFIKGHDTEALLIEIQKIERFASLESENEMLRSLRPSIKCMANTKNKKFQKVVEMAEKAAESNINILILGESGVGKEVMADHIHHCSKRKNHGSMAVSCHALSENMLESELFGHEKGSFTGAIERRKGRFEAAHGGTLFLDEIGELSLNTQAKLLRAIETRKIERIGSNKGIDVDFRLICATNRDLHKAVEEGLFREDLFFRISSITIEIPPLRDRKEDIPDLINYFVRASEKEMKKKIHRIEAGVMDFLLTYPYPGNIRELKNIVERLVVLSTEGVIKEAELPEVRRNDEAKMKTTSSIIKPLKDVRKEFEARYIEEVLMLCNQNISEAAKKLHVSRRQLFNKITEYGLK